MVFVSTLKHLPRNLASILVKKGIRPGQITLLSVFCGLVGAASFWATPHAKDFRGVLLLLFVTLIGLWGRALCERVDDLMAKQMTARKLSGQFMNEIPERLSETAIFLGAAFSVPSETIRAIGLAAALFSVCTAYIRVIGASAGVPSFFSGPMAKRHRVLVMTLCVIACGYEKFHGLWGRSIGVALLMIALGALMTCLNRLRLIYRTLSRP